MLVTLEGARQVGTENLQRRVTPAPAGTAVQGSMTKDMFYDYLALNVVSGTVLQAFVCCYPNNNTIQLPKCSAFPGPLSVLVMDNASIHPGDKIVELIESFGMSRPIHEPLC